MLSIFEASQPADELLLNAALPRAEEAFQMAEPINLPAAEPTVAAAIEQRGTPSQSLDEFAASAPLTEPPSGTNWGRIANIIANVGLAVAPGVITAGITSSQPTLVALGLAIMAVSIFAKEAAKPGPAETGLQIAAA
jgi:hypothetical protein